MRNDKIVPGMILVLIGAAFLLHNFGYLHFHWENFAFLWPIFIVIAGVNLVLASNRSTWATILKASVIIGGFAIILFGDFSYKHNWWWWGRHNYSYHSDNDDNDENSDDNDQGNTIKQGHGDFMQPYDATVKIARLTVSGGATAFRLNDTTNNLFEANTSSSHSSYQLLGRQKDSTYSLDFKMKDISWNDKDDEKGHEADLKLNTKPIWDVMINAGATDLKFDLSKYKVRSLELNGGAGSFDLKLGNPLQNTNVNISSSATSVVVSIPQNASCQVTREGLFTSDNFDENGLVKKDDGRYETPNFDSATNKIFIHMTGFAGSFKLDRY